MSGQRPAANRSTLLQFKARILGAKKGHGLLKKKRDALKTRFQAMLKEIIMCKKAVGTMVKECAFTYAKAEYACDSEFATAVLNRAKKPSVTLAMKAENCAGVQLPSYQMIHDPAADATTDSLGIGCGGQVIQSCREQHRKGLALFIKMASMQSMFRTLDEEIKMTSRRVNALECVVIPRLQDTMAWVKGEMDEMEREEFFRVKKVVEKKKARLQAELQRELAAKAAASGGGAPGTPSQSKQRIGVGLPNLGTGFGVQQPSSDVLF